MKNSPRKVNVRSRILIALLTCLLPYPVAVGQTPAQAVVASATLSAADQLFASGNFEAAALGYAAEVRTQPSDAKARAGLVRTYLRLDRWDDALTAAQAFAANSPASADAHGLLALALIRAGWQAPYPVEAAQALAIDPQNYWGLMASGRIADWNGKVEDARSLFQKASGFHPELPEAWAALFLVDNSRSHLKEQLTVAQTYVKLNPQGHPHTEILEDAKDLLANASAYGAAFEADPPYRLMDPAKADTPSPVVSEPHSLTLEFSGDYALFPVEINGLPFRLLFDTGGGDDILLSWKSASRLHLPAIAHTYVRGVSGKEKSDTLKAQTMTLAGQTYQSIRIETANGLERTGDGILGGDILQHSVATLDFEKRTVSLAQTPDTQAPPPLPGDKSVALPFHFYHGALFVQLAVNTVPVWALVDTGAYDTTLSLRMAKQQLKTISPDDIRSGTYHGRRGVGNTDNVMEYIASRADSQITVSEVPPAAIPIQTIGTSDLDREVSPSAQCDFEINLWLGMSSFTYARRLTFDYPRRLLTFEYTAPEEVPQTDPPKPKKK